MFILLCFPRSDAYSTLLCKWHPLSVYVWAATFDPNAKALANMIDFIVQ